MKKRSSKIIGLILTLISLTGCGGTMQATQLPTYSTKMKTVEDLGLVTGVLAPENTLDTYKIGGTDLGIPYYDDVREQMYLLFGDTFDGVNNMSGDWRSQTVGISTDFNLVHSEKAYSLISLALDNSIFSKFLHFSKAYFSI